ncbi:AAA family ATPase [Streptomyces virginiae]|uniref:AAA family ATPase n=1 Tax=Streptomyces virginiae TaxID=1961 RepID=UPI00362E3A97
MTDPVDRERRAADLIRPKGIVDLRGQGESGVRLSFPHDAVVIVAGLPGSGKSTLLKAWAPLATVVDPRATRAAHQAAMPSWLPYRIYQPWARLRHMHWIRTEIRRAHPLLVHDCGSRPWMRRWLAGNADRAGRPLHMVLLDVGFQEALSGQQARRRLTSRRVFATHRRGLASSCPRWTATARQQWRDSPPSSCSTAPPGTAVPGLSSTDCGSDHADAGKRR